MPVTLHPLLEALGYCEPQQQRALIKLLQAAGAFGDVKGVDGILTDKQADAILAHLTFNDSAQAANLLHQITQESLLRDPNIERHESIDSPHFQKHRAELTQALQDAGMLSELKPIRKHYDHVLLLGTTEDEVKNRFETLKKLWDDGVRFDKIHMLGSERKLNAASEPSAAKAADEMAMMESHYYDPNSSWPKGLEQVRIFEVNTFNKPLTSPSPLEGEGGVGGIFPHTLQSNALKDSPLPNHPSQGGRELLRPNTQDTVKSWLKTNPVAGEVLVVSSQPYAKYQDAAVKSALPSDFHVETVSASAAKDVKINIDLDSFARQIDVNFPQLLEKLASAPGVLKTPIIGIAPEDIKVDAATYQFRSGGDANGVTTKGRYQADHWDPILHGDPILVHERLDGSKYVADGHHRVELAKELNAKGTGPGNIMAMVLSEKQGYTAKDAKIIAAYKNIAHGQTDIVETARVFKEAFSGEVNTDLLPHLQMDKGNLRMAYTMSKLSDKVLDQVAKEKIEPKIAAKLAELVPDDSNRQEAVMQIISRKLQQNYEQTDSSRASSINVNMSPLPAQNDATKVPGFVAKLAMERSRGVSHSRT